MGFAGAVVRAVFKWCRRLPALRYRGSVGSNAKSGDSNSACALPVPSQPPPPRSHNPPPPTLMSTHKPYFSDRALSCPQLCPTHVFSQPPNSNEGNPRARKDVFTDFGIQCDFHNTCIATSVASHSMQATARGPGGP